MFYTTASAQKKNFLQSLPIYSIIFVGISLLFLILTYVSGAMNIVHNALQVHSYSSLVFTIMSMVAVIPLCIFVLNAVVAENEFQLRLVLFIAVLMTLVSVISVTQSMLRDTSAKNTESILHKIVMLTSCVLGLFLLLAFLLLSIPVERSFGWRVFQQVGTRPDIIRRYKVILWWDTLARGDLILITIVLLLSIAFNGLQSMAWPTLICLPLLIIATILSYSIVKRIGIYREIAIVQVAYIGFSFIVPAYLAFKMIMMVSYEYAIPSWVPLNDKEWTIDSNFVVIVMTMTVVFALILRVALIILSVIVLMNFKQGMKNIFAKKASDDTKFLLLQQ